VVQAVHANPEWLACVVAAPGPSLTPEVADAVYASGLPVLAVNDAYKRLPFADILYACDACWWHARAGAREFGGERWSSIGLPGRFRSNDKTREQAEYGMRLVFGDDRPGFSVDPAMIHYGSNSGFQAVNMALLLGARHIVLVGFDMGGTHFFGAHTQPLRNTGSYVSFIRAFNDAAKRLPFDVIIVNGNPASNLLCFPRMDLDNALSTVAGLGRAHRCKPVSAEPVARESTFARR
jgi:hypothetical protein